MSPDSSEEISGPFDQRCWEILTTMHNYDLLCQGIPITRLQQYLIKETRRGINKDTLKEKIVELLRLQLIEYKPKTPRMKFKPVALTRAGIAIVTNSPIDKICDNPFEETALLTLLNDLSHHFTIYNQCNVIDNHQYSHLKETISAIKTEVTSSNMKLPILSLLRPLHLFMIDLKQYPVYRSTPDSEELIYKLNAFIQYYQKQLGS